MRIGNNQHVRELQKEIAKLIGKENRLWFHRAKVTWAKFGDKNSKFSQPCVSEEEEKFDQKTERSKWPSDGHK